MGTATIRSPDWDHLFEIAAAQGGLFAAQQAAEAGYSPQLFAYHLGAGRMIRVRPEIYRLAHFPLGDHQDRTVAWFRSNQEGVFSHQTSIALYNLSDILPSRVHVTVPEALERPSCRPIFSTSSTPGEPPSLFGTSVSNRYLIDPGVYRGKPWNVERKQGWCPASGSPTIWRGRRRSLRP